METYTRVSLGRLFLSCGVAANIDLRRPGIDTALTGTILHHGGVELWVLLRDFNQWSRGGSNPGPLDPEARVLPLGHRSPLVLTEFRKQLSPVTTPLYNSSILL